jgi:hypothetical protein
MRSAVLAAACLLVAAVASPGSPSPVSCAYQAQVLVYGQNGWETLTAALAANQTLRVGRCRETTGAHARPS